MKKKKCIIKSFIFEIILKSPLWHKAFIFVMEGREENRRERGPMNFDCHLKPNFLASECGFHLKSQDYFILYFL